jgi:hypothetical protein
MYEGSPRLISEYYSFENELDVQDKSVVDRGDFLKYI